MKYDPFLWEKGVVVTENVQASFYRNFMFILAGPFASLLVALRGLILMLSVELNLFFWWGTLILIVSSLIDIYVNLNPNPNSILLSDGRITHNDGQSLKLLLRYKRYYDDILRLDAFCHNKEYEKGLLEFLRLKKKTDHQDILRMGIRFYFMLEDFKEVVKLYANIEEQVDLTSDDLCNLALSYSYLEDHQKAITIYDKSLRLNPQNFYALNNRGYTLNLMASYKEAITDFDNAIGIHHSFAYAFNNRGLAKIKLGDVDSGLQDIYKSLEIDPDNSYAFKNLAIYFMDKGELAMAYEHLTKSKELDPKTHGITELMKELEIKLGK